MEQMLKQTFNELTIEEFIDPPCTTKYRSWASKQWVRCRCSCGETIEVPLYGVVNGYIKSCGCYRSRKAAETLKKNKENNPTPNAIYLTHGDQTMNLAEWSRETGIPRTTIMYRLGKKLPVDQILARKDDDYAEV